MSFLGDESSMRRRWLTSLLIWLDGSEGWLVSEVALVVGMKGQE